MRRTLILVTGIVLLALAALAGVAAATPAGTTLLVSRPDGTGPFTGTTDAGSGPLTAVSADGRYVAFTSGADGFAPGANPRYVNLFVRDTVANTTTLVNRSDGANGASSNADVSVSGGARIAITVEPGSFVPDGPRDQPHVLVAFSTTATNLVDHVDRTTPPAGGREEVWLRDVTAGTTYLVSRSNGRSGPVADGPSSAPSIAAGPRGAVVAFESTSTNMGMDAPHGVDTTVYMREVTEGITHLVACADPSCGGGVLNGPNFQPSIQLIPGEEGNQLCDPGEFCALVAFTTANPHLAGSRDVDESHTQVMVARMLERNTAPGFDDPDRYEVVSAQSLNPTVLGDASSSHPLVAPGGDNVVFLSTAMNLLGPNAQLPGLLPGATNVPTQAYRHTFFSEINLTYLAAVGARPNGLDGIVDAPIRDLSYGRIRVAYTSGAANLGAPQVGGGSPRAYTSVVSSQPTLLDRPAGAAGAPGNNLSSATAVSADDSTAIFVSRSTNLNAGGGVDFARVYKRGIDPNKPGFNQLTLVSRPSGTGAFPAGDASAGITQRAISSDGRYVAFQSRADDLSSADDNLLTNVFVRDNASGTTTLVSRANGASGAAADQSSELNGISDDGQRILFTTQADNLGAGQSGPHAYVRDLAAQTTTLVTRQSGAGGTIATGSGTSISGDGKRVAFIAGALEPDASNDVSHLYVRDLAAQTTTFADRASGTRGNPAGSDPFDAALDRDGGRVVWTTKAILTTGAGSGSQMRVYVRDLATATTVLASRADGVAGAVANAGSFAPTIDAAGDVVAFESDATNLGPVSDFPNLRSIFVRNLTTGRTELASRGSGADGRFADGPSFAPSLDAAGDRVAFVSTANTIGSVPVDDGEPQGPLPGTEAYVRNLGPKTTEVVSRVNGVNGAPADPGSFGLVSLSASGDCVAFAGSGANYTDPLAGSDVTIVRERVLRSTCNAGSAAPSVAPEPAPGPAPPPLAALTRLLMQPARFFVGHGGGTRISFALSKPATVTLAFDRLVPVRAGRPAARSAAARKARIAVRRVGRLTIRAHAGVNRIRFSGRIHGHALAPGRYRWTATPLHGHARSGRFTVVRAPHARRARHPR